MFFFLSPGKLFFFPVVVIICSHGKYDKRFFIDLFFPKRKKEFKKIKHYTLVSSHSTYLNNYCVEDDADKYEKLENIAYLI